jgi:hypothetical protein
MDEFKTIPRVSFSIEPGDGTGNSIKDAYVRNDRGLCARKDCGKPLSSSGIKWGIQQKLCVEHEKELSK